MYCTRKIDDDIIWVGADDRRATLFEGVYPVPRGMSYNSYLILGEKTALIDTVDRAVTDQFLGNVEHALAGRPLDFLIVQHMEPDHSATLIDVLIRLFFAINRSVCFKCNFISNFKCCCICSRSGCCCCRSCCNNYTVKSCFF